MWKNHLEVWEMKVWDVSKYHNNVPSFFCDSDIDKFLNYNNITHKLRDTHQARDYHPYHYYYYYYYYTVFWSCKGDY